MTCHACKELLDEYKLRASLFKDAVSNIPEGLGDDARVFVDYADRLRQKCNDARDAYTAHWRNHRRNLSKAASA